MENKVIFRDNQELQSADLNNQQDWAQEALDHVVFDTINADKAYSGFTLSKVASTQIKTSSGRVYTDGAVYARNEEVILDLYSDLPVTTKRQFAIVAWGQTVEEDIQPRNFVVDADTGQAEPQSVAMQETRYVNINYVRGIESADPQYPAVDANVVLIGYVLCDPTGVVSYEQSESTQVDNLAVVAADVDALNAWRGVIEGTIDTLRTDLANLAKQLLNYTPLSEFQKLSDLVNILWELVHRPAAYIWYGTDNFFDESMSDTDLTLDSVPYSAYINEGLRFPEGGTWTGTLQLFNPSEPAVETYSPEGYILPKPSGSRVRYDCSFPTHPWVGAKILSFSYWAFNCRQLRWSRWRHRCGPRYYPCSSAQVFWYGSAQDPTKNILSFKTESWAEVNWEDTNLRRWDYDPRWPVHKWDRWKYFWRDRVNVHYWDKVYTDYNHSGNHICQTFYNAQDGWLCGITLFSHKSGFYQPLNLVITGCFEDGTPDHEGQTLRRLVLDANDIEEAYGTPIHIGDIIAGAVQNVFVSWWTIYKSYPLYVFPLRLSFPPVFLRAGQHVGIHVHSTYDHQFSISERDDCFQVHQGHFWHSNGSRLVMWTVGHKTLRFMAHFCTWGRWGDQSSPAGGIRYEINLESLQLAGGISSIDVLAEAIIPAATDLSYEIQLNGVWIPFAADPDSPAFSGNPTLLPFRVVFTGTTDLMPGLSLDESEVTLTGSDATAFHHYSIEVSLGTPSDNIKVVGKVHNYVEANHNLDCSIHYSSTHHPADASSDEVMSDGTLMRTWTFATSAVDTFNIELHGETDGTGDNFFVGQRIAYATPT